MQTPTIEQENDDLRSQIEELKELLKKCRSHVMYLEKTCIPYQSSEK